MATISSPGIGSGLDINSIVTQLIAIERQPIVQLQREASSVQAKLSTYGKLQSGISSLRDAASALTSSSTWGQTVGTSSDATAVTASTNTSSKPGTYSVQATSLASAQTNATSAFAAADSLVGEGSLSIELGTWVGTTFTPKAGTSTVNITVGSPGQTVAQLRDTINASNAGVTASVLTDVSGARLVIRSTSTGEENGFRISVADTDGNNADASGLSALAYDPQAGVSTMARSQAAADATALIDGLSVRSASNTLSGVIDGVSVTLAKVTAAPVLITVAQDNEAIKSKIDAFVTAYNEVNTLLAEQTKYDAATKTAGLLQGDSAALSMRSQLRNMIGIASGASSAFSRLADVGFDVRTDGSITLSAAKLDFALSNPTEIRKLFSNNDLVTPANRGVALQLRDLADAILGADGTLQARTDGLNRRLDSNQDRQDRLTDRIALVEKRLRTQYTALDVKMGQLSSVASYMTQQLALINNQSN